MFFGSNKRHQRAGGASRPSCKVTDQAAPPHAPQLLAWREAARKVTRSWNAWLAAERHDRASRYRAFVAALAEEELAAAEVERVSELPETGRLVTTIRSAG
jgi:hypothetical protein